MKNFSVLEEVKNGERGGLFFINNFKYVRTIKGKCIYCSELGGIIRNGFRYLKKSPYRIQKYFCLRCMHNFSESKYKRMRTPEFIIDKIVYGDFNGSSREIRGLLIDKENFKISHVSIINLKRRFKK